MLLFLCNAGVGARLLLELPPRSPKLSSRKRGNKYISVFYVRYVTWWSLRESVVADVGLVLDVLAVQPLGPSHSSTPSRIIRYVCVVKRSAVDTSIFPRPLPRAPQRNATQTGADVGFLLPTRTYDQVYYWCRSVTECSYWSLVRWAVWRILKQKSMSGFVPIRSPQSTAVGLQSINKSTNSNQSPVHQPQAE